MNINKKHHQARTVPKFNRNIAKMDRINTRNTHKTDHPLCRKWGYQRHCCILWFSFALWTRKSACKHKSWISWVFFNRKKSFNYTWPPTLLEVTISDIHYDLSFTITACQTYLEFQQIGSSSIVLTYNIFTVSLIGIGRHYY
jgi:hypothetical protein